MPAGRSGAPALCRSCCLVPRPLQFASSPRVQSASRQKIRFRCLRGSPRDRCRVRETARQSQPRHRPPSAPSARSHRGGRSLCGSRREMSGRPPPSWRWRAHGRAGSPGRGRRRAAHAGSTAPGAGSAASRRAPQSVRRHSPRKGIDAEAGCRKRGWSALSARRGFPARERTAAAPRPPPRVARHA